MIGKIICDLRPNESNNRNSEGAFIKLKNGELLFAYTRYRSGGFEDHAAADIYGMISEDEGETFGRPFLLFSCEDVDADNVMSVSLIRMKNGDIGMFYLKKKNTNDNTPNTCIPYLSISSDEGKTWNKHIRCIAEDGYYTLNNDRVIVLNNGRILMPVSKALIENGSFSSGNVIMYASDDNGKTWECITEKIEMNAAENMRKNFNAVCNAMEPGVVQLENGMVWCYIRTELGRQYESFSKDFGVTWTPSLPSPFTSPSSPMCVKKLQNKKLFCVWNPAPVYNGKSEVINDIWTGARTPLTFAVLGENGEFDSEPHIIESDENAGFCYCAIHETEKGDILLAYCAGGTEDGCCLSKLRIRKICKNELI